MFGYVKPLNPELRMREYECYRAYYCGLCRSMGSCTGQCSRLSLSYDFVFLAAVRCYLAGEVPRIKKIYCLSHPFRRRKAVASSPQLAYCADASALLSYRKCRDDLSDECGWKKFRALIVMIFLHRAYRKAKKRHPELDRVIAEKLTELQNYERAPSPPSADIPAGIFGDLMKAVFAEDFNGTSARLAAEFGQTIGRWIYLADAADDFEADRKRGRFNPYLLLFGPNPTGNDWNMVRTSLLSILCETERAFLLLGPPPCPELKEIIANILYLGLPETASKVIPSAPQNTQSTTEKETIHE